MNEVGGGGGGRLSVFNILLRLDDSKSKFNHRKVLLSSCHLNGFT